MAFDDAGIRCRRCGMKLYRFSLREVDRCYGVHRLVAISAGFVVGCPRFWGLFMGRHKP